VLVGVCNAFLVNMVAVGLLGAFTLGYKKTDLDPSVVKLKFRSNFWQHALPAFISVGALHFQKEGMELKYLTALPVLQLLYMLTPYEGKIAFQKFEAVYDVANPATFFGVTDLLIVGTALMLGYTSNP
jgi:hypothetical protein